MQHTNCIVSNSSGGLLGSNCRTGWPKEVCIFASLCGLNSTAVWFIVLFPQLVKNFRRKSVQGLSVLWATANFTASLINLFFVFIHGNLPIYSKINAVYMPTLEFSLLVQFLWYGHHYHRKTKILYSLLCVAIWTTIITLELVIEDISPQLQWVAITLWCIETFPQVILNMNLQSTTAQSKVSVGFALYGKTTDFLSQYLLCIPLQYVIMAYFSSSMCYINGVQIAWYKKKPTKDGRPENEEAPSGYEYVDDPTFTTDSPEDEIALIIPEKKEKCMLGIRIFLLVFEGAILFGFVVGLIWNTGTFVSVLAPSGILLILGFFFLNFKFGWSAKLKEKCSQKDSP